MSALYGYDHLDWLRRGADHPKHHVALRMVADEFEVGLRAATYADQPYGFHNATAELRRREAPEGMLL